ncbi:MAG: hypothetical protein J7621_08430 [Niastella sp.]|nr:hypothetical protein [Niastella sp.]
MKKVLVFFCVLGLVLGCKQKKTSKEADTITIDGIEMPIGSCIDVQNKVFGNSIDTKKFCTCFLPLLYDGLKNDPEMLELFKKGKLEFMSQFNKDSFALVYEHCINDAATTDSTTRLVLTPRMVKSIKATLMQRVREEGMEQIVDVDLYCDCIIDGLQTHFTAKEVMQENFNETEKYTVFMQQCQEKAKKVR